MVKKCPSKGLKLVLQKIEKIKFNEAYMLENYVRRTRRTKKVKLQQYQLENLRLRGSGSLVWRIWNLRIRLILFHGSTGRDRLTSDGWAMLQSAEKEKEKFIFFSSFPSEGIFCFGASEIGCSSTANDNLDIKCTIKTYYFSSRLCCTVGHFTSNQADQILYETSFGDFTVRLKSTLLYRIKWSYPNSKSF